MAIQTFVAGSVLTAAQLNTLQQQAVMTFTNEAARSAALPSPNEGMVAYLTTPTVPAAVGATSTSLPTGILTIYNGSVWVCTSSIGATSGGASQNFTTAQADITIGGSLTSVTLVTGTTALVSFGGRIFGDGNFAQINVKVGAAISGDFAAFNTVNGSYITVGRTYVMTGLTAGTNTFTMVCQSNTNGTASVDDVTLTVQGIA
jgi:hypothetical protein